MNKEITRCISIFQRVGDDFVGSVEITNSEFKNIRKLLGFNESQKMYDSYLISGNTLKLIKDFLGERLPIGDYEYFLEVES